MEWELTDAKPLSTDPEMRSASTAGVSFASPVGVGKSGGVLFGNGGDSRDVKIVILHCKDQGQGFCGGVIGRTGNKMCVARDCKVLKHSSEKAPLADIHEERAYICTKERDAVFTQPSVPSFTLSPSVDAYLNQARPIASWETLFRSIQSNMENPKSIHQPVEQLVKTIDENAEADDAPVPFTPMKKRAKLDVESPSWAVGVDNVIASLEADLGPTPDVAAESFRKEWVKLVANLELYDDLVRGNRDLITRFISGVKSEFSQVDLDVSKLANLIGKRPEELGTMTLFDCVELALRSSIGDGPASTQGGIFGGGTIQLNDLISDIEKVRHEVKQFETSVSAAHPAPQTEFKTKLQEELRQSLLPIFDLFTLLSSKKEAPGDILANELNLIKSDMSNLAARVQQVATSVGSAQGSQNANSQAGQTANSRGFAWQLSGTTSAPSTNTVASQPTSTMGAQIKALEERVKDLQDQMDSQRVEIETSVFVSLPATAAWVKAKAPSPLAFAYFVDPHSFLNIGSEVYDMSSNTEGIAFESSVIKAGYANPMDALVVKSFKRELPSFFGYDASINGLVKKDSRVLPAIKSFEVWDTQDGFNGARYRFEDVVKETKETLYTSVTGHLDGEGQMVARAMITDTAVFLSELGAWISSQYRDLVGRGGAPKQTWQLIAHCVRSIFTDLHRARRTGRGPHNDPNARASGIVWGCLQAHKLMQEYRAIGFQLIRR